MLSKQEIRQLGSKEMMEELQKSRRDLLKSQFEMRMGTSKEVHVAKNLKKYIARLQTITREAKPNVASAQSGHGNEASQSDTKSQGSLKAKKSPAPKKSSQTDRSKAKVALASKRA